MWLLDASTKKLHYFVDEREVKYAILSHTWAEEEASYQDIQNGDASCKKGYEKVRYTCEQALKEGLAWVWIDTLCINKESSAELSEAINSMYRWYAAATKCYVFLSDAYSTVAIYKNNVFSPDPRTMSSDDCSLHAKDVLHGLQLHHCRWFWRGWTLQELIAPLSVDFFGPNWYFLGTKSSLLGTIANITNIDQEVLEYPESMASLSTATKMSWASQRQTSRLEDRAYSLLGIFDINMPLLYGEGSKSFLRLQEEIMRHSTDLSILAWNNDSCDHQRHLLALSPDDFGGCQDVVYYDNGVNTSYQLTNKGLEARIPLAAHNRSGTKSCVFGVLNCRVAGNPVGPLVIRLERAPNVSRTGGRTQPLEQNIFVISPWDGIFSRAHVLPLEDLKFANTTSVTILSSPKKLPLASSTKIPSSIWIHLASESYMGPWSFHPVKLETTSMKRFEPRSGQVRSLQDSRISIASEDTDLYESIETYPHDTCALWSIKKQEAWQGSLKVLVFGVAVRAYENYHQTILFYRQLSYKEYQERSGSLGPIGIHRILDNVAPSDGFVAAIEDWTQIIVKTESTLRMGEKVFAISVSLYGPAEHVPTSERLSMGSVLETHESFAGRPATVHEGDRAHEGAPSSEFTIIAAMG